MLWGGEREDLTRVSVGKKKTRSEKRRSRKRPGCVFVVRVLEVVGVRRRELEEESSDGGEHEI